MSILEKIGAAIHRRTQKDVRNARDLVRKIAEDELRAEKGLRPLTNDNVDADRAAEILTQAGWDTQRLGAEVELLKRRRDLRAKLEQGKEADRLIGRVVERVEALNEERKALLQKHQEKADPVHAELRRLQATISASQGIEQQLVESCSNEEFLSQLAEIEERRKALLTQQQEADRNARAVELALMTARDYKEKAERKGFKDQQAIADFARLEASAKQAASAQQHLASEAEALAAEEAGVHLLMLDP